MNLKEMITVLADMRGTTKKAEEEHLRTVLETITATLETGENVEIYGFGKFKIGSRKAYTARNPSNGEPVDVPEKTTVTFKAAKKLKDMVNG